MAENNESVQKEASTKSKAKATTSKAVGSTETKTTKKVNSTTKLAKSKVTKATTSKKATTVSKTVAQTTENISKRTPRGLRVNKNKTFIPSVKGMQRKWKVYDASSKPVGRLATEIAKDLMGKYDANWDNAVDTGDCVVVYNTDKLVFTGRKFDQKAYYRHSLYLGGLTKTLVKQQMQKDSTFIIKNAVSKMLPKNKHRARRMARLHVFATLQHPYIDKFKN